MGIFDRLKSVSVPTFDVQRAIMTIVVAAVKADGEVTYDERLRIRSICSGTPIFASNSSDQDDVVIAFADKVTSQFGVDAIDHAAVGLRQELRETAFTLACDMVLADGVMESREEAFLTTLAEKLRIQESIIGSVIEVTMIRNRCA